MGESPTKQLTVTIPTTIAMVYYQHPEIADSSNCSSLQSQIFTWEIINIIVKRPFGVKNFSLFVRVCIILI